MGWYRTGTVSVTNGSTTVTGSGTAWIGPVKVGDAFAGPDGRNYEIDAMTSGTSIAIVGGYLGASTSGGTYSIIPTQSRLADLSTQASTLINDFRSASDAAAQFEDTIIPGYDAQVAAFITAAEAELIAALSESDATLRLKNGALQRLMATATASAPGGALTATSETGAVWVDPAGAEQTGDSISIAAQGTHQLWLPADQIGPGVNFQASTSAALTHLAFTPASSQTVVIANQNDLRRLKMPEGASTTILQAHTNQLTDLDFLPGLTDLVTLNIHTNQLEWIDVLPLGKLKFISLHSNGMSTAAVSAILGDLVASGVTDCTVNIGGTNLPPNTAGLGHVQTLNGRNCPVTHS